MEGVCEPKSDVRFLGPGGGIRFQRGEDVIYKENESKYSTWSRLPLPLGECMPRAEVCPISVSPKRRRADQVIIILGNRRVAIDQMGKSVRAVPALYHPCPRPEVESSSRRCIEQSRIFTEHSSIIALLNLPPHHPIHGLGMVLIHIYIYIMYPPVSICHLSLLPACNSRVYQQLSCGQQAYFIFRFNFGPNFIITCRIWI